MQLHVAVLAAWTNHVHARELCQLTVRHRVPDTQKIDSWLHTHNLAHNCLHHRCTVGGGSSYSAHAHKNGWLKLENDDRSQGRMSWLDSSFSFAKTAFSTAQKSIDRVLDIKEDKSGGEQNGRKF